MMTKMQKLVLEEGKKFFDVWTTMVSDDILAVSHAFGERYALEAACDTLENDCVHAGASKLLERVIYLHMVHLVI